MRSVACSGARVVFDYLPSMKNYVGQHRELASDDEASREQKRQDALDNFKPGVVPQLEFVKKYKPNIVTFTGGGNDIGFADILAYCAMPHWEELVLPSSISDCGYAVPGSDLQKMLFDAIDTQYALNKRLVEKLKEVSPATKVIIVGYPSFISSDNMTCSLTFNSGALTQRERTAINMALSRLNAMLKKVAYDTGVSYVDIEDVLNGGRMCEGSKYITGITAAGYREVISGESTQEIFHPNAYAHEKIAEAIRRSGAFVSNTTPSSASYSPNKNATTALLIELIEEGRFVVGSSIKIITSPFMFSPNSSVYVTGFSDKVELGTYTTDSEGALRKDVDMSLLPAGKHVLLLEGVSFSGEPVRYYQFITVVDPPNRETTSSQSSNPSKEDSGDTAEVIIAKQTVQGVEKAHTLREPSTSLASGDSHNESGGITRNEQDIKGISENTTSLMVEFIFLGGVLLGGGTLYAIKRQKKNA